VTSEAELEQQAQRSDPEAQLALGRLLLTGPRASVDGARGVRLVEQAGRAGHPEANAALALFDAMGVSGPADWGRAFGRLQLAADQGSANAHAQLRLLAQASGPVPGTDAPGGLTSSELRQRVDIGSLLHPGERHELSRSPRVWTIDRFASPPECQWIIDRARDRLRAASVISPGSGADIHAGVRTNSKAEFQLLDMDVTIEAVRARISAAVGVPLPGFEPTQVLHYAPGEQFHPHVDYFDPANPAYREQLGRGQRIATFLIYLNEGFEGGETEFVDAGLKFRGNIGAAIFWANVDAHGRTDTASRHAGLPPRSGEKWILSQWIRDRAGQAR
jgi:prolyl 4-hydroxylase